MDLLPLFPLGLVLYPKEELPLHIFEPRYRELVAECQASETVFGVVMVEDEKMAQVGCTARISKVLQTYEDGRLDIVVVGEERFRIGQVVSDRAYLRADVERVLDQRRPLSSELRERAITLHIKLLELAGHTPNPGRYSRRKPLSYFVAHNSGMTLAQKQAVLELRSERDRIEFLVAHMSELIPRIEEAEELRRRIGSNGHFRDFPPKTE